VLPTELRPEAVDCRERFAAHRSWTANAPTRHLGEKWNYIRPITPPIGAPLQRNNCKCLIEKETACMAWISLTILTRGSFGQ
jgi:hypothetical protein